MALHDLEALEMLTVLSETGSVLATSRRLNLPRTTVKRRLEQLEAALGVELLSPQGNRLRLTRAGEAVARGSVEVLTSARRLQQAARDEDSRAHLFRIALPNGLSWGMFAPLLGSRADLFDDLSIELVNVDHEVHPVREGFDLVVSFKRPTDEGLMCRVFGTLSWRCLVTREYLARHGRPERPEDLVRHKLASVSMPGCPGPRVWPLRRGGTIDVAPWFVGNSIEPVQQLVLTGRALALLPTLVEVPPPFQQVLFGDRPDDVGVEGELFLVTPQSLARTVSGRSIARLADAATAQLQRRLQARVEPKPRR